MTVTRLLARPMLSSIFVVGAVNALKSSAGHAQAADPVTSRLVPLAKKAGIPLPENPETLVKINAATQLAAGLALATGRLPRTSAAVLAASLVPTTAVHRYWEISDPGERAQQRIHFFKNHSLLGGLIIAAGDTAGKPGVAWRAKHAAHDAAREARAEARLLKARVS
jgi:uncharacterized membrane protein YphA (DoxX/SURF4 family)